MPGMQHCSRGPIRERVVNNGQLCCRTYRTGSYRLHLFLDFVNLAPKLLLSSGRHRVVLAEGILQMPAHPSSHERHGCDGCLQNSAFRGCVGFVSYLMRLFWLDACFTKVCKASRTESVTLYLRRAVRGRLEGLVGAVTKVKCRSHAEAMLWLTTCKSSSYTR